jgi:hypothetical protein
MSIDLTTLEIADCDPMPMNHGGVVRSPLGGGQNIDRMGSHWAFRFQSIVMDMEPDGRQWSALFDRAERSGGLFRIRQPNLDVGSPGSPIIAADTPIGRFLPLAGLTPRYEIRGGQWLSVIVDGQRYLDRVMERVVAEADGTATVEIKYLIRAPMSAGDVVELAVPKIEGSIIGGYGGGWAATRTTSFSFTVEEDD